MYLGDSYTPLSPFFNDDMEASIKRTIIPEIIYDRDNPEQIKALAYNKDGKRYYFSNEEGHKVYSEDRRSCRPMTKREFKDICTLMLEQAGSYGETEATILAQIENLDFGLGHANSTFEVVLSCMSLHRIGALALNIGTSRYLYNQEAETVFHIDHSKLINGTMLKSPEKDAIIQKITSSKTMTKKINQALNS